MSYTICNTLDMGQAYTGATLNAQLVDISQNPVGSAITTGFYENSGGLGLFDYALTIPDGHQGWVHVYVSGASSTILVSLPINPAELELHAIADAILRRGSANSDNSADRDSLYELIAIMMRSQTVSTTLTVYTSDGTTSFGTRTLTLDNAAQPITKIA